MPQRGELDEGVAFISAAGRWGQSDALRRRMSVPAYWLGRFIDVETVWVKVSRACELVVHADRCSHELELAS
eukprot:12178000-Alexandrium_andersonii.AAC.1